MNNNTRIFILQAFAAIFIWISGFFSGALYVLKHPPEDLSPRAQQILRYEQKDL